MQTILNNPYRIIGILVGTSAKEQIKQIKQLKQFVEAEQNPQEDFSFPEIGYLKRDLATIEEAVSKLNLDHDRMSSAIFWFYNGNNITDEPAFDCLKDSGIQKAVEIWTKLTSNGEVTKRNCSAFQNLSSLLLFQSIQDSSFDEDYFKQGVSLKLKFLESDFVNELIQAATDVTFKTNKKDIQLSFLTTLQGELEQSDYLPVSDFVKFLNEENFTAKDEFLLSSVQSIISKIESLINECKTLRKQKTEVIIAGTNLYKSARPQLITIRDSIGVTNQKFITIADKVSEEILQCGIQLFNDYKDSETFDTGDAVMKLFVKSNALAVGKIVKQRCKENTENLQEWIDDKPERELNKKIGKDAEYIIEKLNLAAETLKNKGRYPRGYNDPYSDLPLSQQPHNKIPDSPLERRLLLEHTSPFLDLTSPLRNNEYNINLFRLARDTVKNCKPKLENIKNSVGVSNEVYQKLSNDVASISLACLIEFVNNSGNPTLGIPPNIDEHEVNAMNAIGELDMNYEMRKRYNEQNQSLINLRKAVRRSNSRSSGSGGCYIATMAYGDYNHPKVLILRRYRDNVLSKYILGRMFIKYYYFFSPRIVKLLNNQEVINSFIRKILNQIIKKINI